MRNLFIKKIVYLLLTLFCFLLIVGGILFITTAFIQTGQFRAQDHSQNVFWFCFILTIILVIYTFATWLKIGRDPIYVPVARYEPPEGISPAFAYYLYNEQVDHRLLRCILLDLAMKKYIQEQTVGKGANKQVYLTFKKHAEWDLPEEERIVLESLYDHRGPCALDETNAGLLEDIIKRIENRFIMRRDKYIIGNEKYIILPILITLCLGVIPALFSADVIISLFMNIVFAIFFIVLTGIVHDPRKKIIAGISNTILFLFFVAISLWYEKHPYHEPLHYAGSSFTQLFYLISLWITVFYISLIRNVTALGRKTFEHLNGFKEYIKTAESNRFALSNPEDEERIFCNYLPYAFVFDLYNPWIERASHILSKEIIAKNMAYVGISPMGNSDLVSYRLQDIFSIVKNDSLFLKR